MVLEKLQPSLVWEIFEDVFTKTPRESKKEEKIRKKIKEWVEKKAHDENLDIIINTDDIGNILIKVPGTKGMELYPPVILQGHMDMVCETDRPDGFDFDNLPIPVQIEANQEWVVADHTTLGADNGIGCALALALIFDKNVQHGPIEVLLTIDEETGLTGAFQLDVNQLGITGKLLINIDSEDLHTITIGSAGGGSTEYHMEFILNPLDEDHQFLFYELNILGLFGGHSGGDIHLPRANALKLAARILAWLNRQFDIYLHGWKGGSKHNAIPRTASVKFAINKNQESKLHQEFLHVKQDLLNYYHEFEPDLEISLNSIDRFSISSKELSREIIEFFHILPHGALKFSPQVPGLVETSNNLAIIESDETHIMAHCSSRSNLDTELENFRMKMRAIGEKYSWQIDQDPAYPGWKPDPNSSFLQYVKKCFVDVMGDSISINAIHAGLECGVIGAKIPGLQMLSIGPQIKNPHTPDERVNISSVANMYKILQKILQDLSTLS